MDITLVVNPGSASKKYAFYKENRQVLTITFEHVDDGYGSCVEINGERQTCESIPSTVFESAIEEVVSIAQKQHIFTSEKEISRVGVRIVAPGTFFESHRIIDDGYIRNLKLMEDAAPLHIPHTIHEIERIKKNLPDTVCIGVSDSAFHSTIPEYSRRYSIRREDRESYDVYRFGYHGLSVSSVLERAQEITGTKSQRSIVCHVGSGVSVTAVAEGKSVETTMGFSPTSGLMMNSRSGDLDASALLYLMKKKHLSVTEAEVYIAKQGGFMGALGQNDLRIILDRRARGDVEASIYVDSFAHHLRKAIGAYTAILGGVDLLVLTATAVERNPIVRELVVSTQLHGLGIVLDGYRNDSLAEREGEIHAEKSATKIVVVHTREMEQIGRIASLFTI